MHPVCFFCFFFVVVVVVVFCHLRAFRSFYCHNNNNNNNNNNNIFFNNNNVELDSRLPLAACGPEQDHKAIYNLVPLLPKRGIYIRICTSISFFLFLFSQQVPAAKLDMIPRHFFSRWLTSQDGRLWNCLRQGSIVLTDIPYTTARLMDLLSDMAGTYTLSTRRHLVAVPMPTLVILTAHQAGTTMETPSPRHFWQEEVIIILLQTK